MLTPIHSPAQGKLRVLGYASGSGDTLWKAFEMQREMEATPHGAPFEIVGVFCDNPVSKCAEKAKAYGVPFRSVDIRAFYAERGAPLKDRTVRAEYDRDSLALVRPLGADAILLAGYVWATTDAVLDEYLVINVHPGDLSVMRDGKRAFAGANGVGKALQAGEAALASSSHLATKQIDGGPLLMISESVPVDYALHDDNEARFRHYLKLVNEQSRLIGARTLLEIAQGNFAADEAGAVYYNGEPAPLGHRITEWSQDIPHYLRKTEKLLYPDSVAVIGASRKPGIGRAVIQNLLRDRFPGRVYAVNVRGESVDGAEGFASVLDIPGSVDLAILTVPSGAVPEVAQACGQKGVSALICITAGFKETGAAGAAAERALMDIVNRYNMRMIGPNCMGLLNAGAHLSANMLTNEIIQGNVAMITQSGAIGASMLDYAGTLGIGFSAIISLGNQADVTVCDLLPFLEADAHTRVIVLYLETILEPVRLWQYAARMRKPIILLKSGATAAGATAATSHTGSLAGNDSIAQALIEKAGILRVDTLEDCFMSTVALSQMPRFTGNRVCLLTNAGGPGILIADAASRQGFDMPQPSEGLRAQLAAGLMKEASTGNPIDVVAPAPPEHYVHAAKAVIASGEYDALLVCCVPPATVDTEQVARALAPVLKASPLPVIANFFGPTLCDAARDVLRRARIPVSEYPEQTATMLASLRMRTASPGGNDERPPRAQVTMARQLLSKADPGAYLAAEDAYGLLELFGIRCARNATVASPEAAEGLSLEYPVVAKIDHPDIIHKSDVGGVVLGIEDAPALRKVTGALMEKFPGANGVFVQEMVPAGLELIVGSAGDSRLGQAVMVGLGGVWVEVMKDVRFAYLPLTRHQAEEMVQGLRCAPLLRGYRGKPGVNLDALVGLLMRVGAMLLALPEIGELDMNPILYDARRDAWIAADARIRRA